MKSRIFGYTLIISGVVLIIITLSLNTYYSYKQKLLRSELENSFIELDFNEDNKINPEIINNEDNDNNDQDNETNDNQINNINAIAILKIDKIDLKVAVVEGTSLENLNYAVGHFTETANVGENGNFALAGHRSYAFGEYFNRLDELNYGDIILIENKNGSYEYIITDKFIVEATDTWVLNETDSPTITLVTCTIGGKKRLIVKGKLEKS